jgi:serine/threonine protein kinase
MIKCILNVLSLLKIVLWVHCDLKSENILIEIDYNKKEITSVKVIDFGSSFYFNNINDELGLTTPEYLPPEALEFIEYK